MKIVHPEITVAVGASIGESPVRCPQRKRLLWIDLIDEDMLKVLIWSDFLSFRRCRLNGKRSGLRPDK